MAGRGRRMGSSAVVTFSMGLCAAIGLASVGRQPESRPEIPLGMPPLPVPHDNPLTAETVELGRRLYFDPRLSRDGTISCATCHNPATG